MILPNLYPGIIIFLQLHPVICTRSINSINPLPQPALADLGVPKHSCSLQRPF